MKYLSLSFVVALLNSPLFVSGTKTSVREIGEGVIVKGNEVEWDSKEGPFRDSYVCRDPYILCLSADRKYAGCCEHKNGLKGSKETEFHCCADGHDLAGSKEVGFQCCPTGNEFDGKICKLVCKNGEILVYGKCTCPEGQSFDGKSCKATCTNGKRLVDGKCVCPEGQTEAADGSCKKTTEGGCSSGLVTGRCYMFKGETGRKLACKGGQYSETLPHKDAIPGKFQLCRDEKCTPGKPINPSHEIHIKDLHGTPPNSADDGQWLNNASGGSHIGKTKEYSKSGNFTITKWPCGKYCLSGMDRGLGPACPAAEPSFTFYGTNLESCIEFELIEVPCKIREDVNNCIWKHGKNQCCGNVDCSGPSDGAHHKPQPTDPDSKPPPPKDIKPPKTPLAEFCPAKDHASIDVQGTPFRIHCGFTYEMVEDKVEVIKDIIDPVICHTKCAQDKKCQGANFDFTKATCTHCFEWTVRMKLTKDESVIFRPRVPRLP